MAEIVKCPACGSEGESAAGYCTKCKVYIRSELQCLNEINASLRTIKNIVVGWVLLSALIGIAYIVARAR
jgi:hypothetical protein